MLRNWFKSIIFECLYEQLKEQPLIISSRAPNPEDVYHEGTIWMYQRQKFIAKKVSVIWEKYEE